jgi:hypothetical protein
VSIPASLLENEEATMQVFRDCIDGFSSLERRFQASFTSFEEEETSQHYSFFSHNFDGTPWIALFWLA